MKMVRVSRALFKDNSGGITKLLSDLLVCPLSKQPLRISQESNSLISDAVGVSFPIVDGIPRLVPKDGKLLETDDTSKSSNAVNSSVVSTGCPGGNSC